jgi:hypothetical protein
MKTKNRVPVSFGIPRQTKEIIDRKAAEDGRTRASLMRIGLVRFAHELEAAGSWAELRLMRLVTTKKLNALARKADVRRESKKAKKERNQPKGTTWQRSKEADIIPTTSGSEDGATKSALT